ncbi:MAG TPA: transglycosylase domain-containing protein [Gaiellaceae bacterium]|nr:transglycosylase domain-containing protein [Gaiellaceae bacterium]
MPPRPRDDDELTALIVSRRSRLRRRRSPGRRFGLAVAIAAGAIVVAVLTGGALTGAVLSGSCDTSALKPIALGSNSFLYASNGSLLGVVPTETNRQPLPLDAISRWLPKATIAIEDRRFWQHGALDYQGIARALYSDVTAGKIVQGGSTITQELVRNLYIGNSKRTFGRKLKEACLAVRLSEQWSKSQILSAYLNDVFYGRHAYGAQAGAQTFFSTTAQRLTLPQAALLAGLPQAPSVYNPVTHPATALRRRDEVLRALLAGTQITPRQYSQAVGAPLGLKLGQLYSVQVHPNFFGWAEQQLIRRYDARGVEGGGLQIKTTLDMQMQNEAQTAIASVLKEKTDPSAALVAIDPRTGAVRAMLGYTPDGRKLQFNLATQSGRTAGSAFKPFVLATAAQQGISLYSGFSGPSQLTIPDQKCATNGVPWTVHNFADESGGYMSLLSATAHSVNTIFAQLVLKVGPANVVKIAHKMGITSALQAVCSITLGTQAINPLEMTDGYATLAARGIHHAPQAIEIARGPNGQVIDQLNTKGDRVLSQNAADLVTYALQGVVQYGTGTAASLGSRPAAGKTGTAENFEDAWFCGFVPQLATCVWVGYPKAEIPLLGVEGVGQVFGGSLPAEIWNRFMSAAVAGLAVQQFATPTFTGHYVTGIYSPPPQPTVIDVPPGAVSPPPKGGR